jgi:hypothetical protein
MTRPTKEAEPGTTVTISLRVPAELKTRLEARAAKNHRNLSQESERALERSFDPSLLVADALSQLSETDRFTVASEHMGAIARTIFGEAGTVGFDLMRTLALARMVVNADTLVTITSEHYEALCEAFRDVERLCAIEGTNHPIFRHGRQTKLFEGDDDGQGAHQGARRSGQVGDPPRRRTR